MRVDTLDKLRELLLNNGKPVSGVEYTSGNYDNDGNLIKEKIPTITTDYCEIGLYKNEIYFVIIIESETFTRELFGELKNEPDLKIYSFTDFNKTLYPAADLKLNKLLQDINKDKYIQIQLDYNDVAMGDLFREYLRIVELLNNQKVKIVNQLQVNKK